MMESKKVQYTANLLAEKIDEIYMEHGLPLPKRVTKTGYILTMSQKPKEELNTTSK